LHSYGIADQKIKVLGRNLIKKCPVFVWAGNIKYICQSDFGLHHKVRTEKIGQHLVKRELCRGKEIIPQTIWQFFWHTLRDWAIHSGRPLP